MAGQPNGHDEEARMFVAEDAIEDVMTELEQRHALERDSRVAAGIQIDLQDRGPLYLYVKERRNQAKQALIDMVAEDPTNALAISAHQNNIREYLKVCNWIHRGIDAGKQADDTIMEQYEHHDNDAESEPHQD